jgi:hypothetical protein
LIGYRWPGPDIHVEKHRFRGPGNTKSPWRLDCLGYQPPFLTVPNDTAVIADPAIADAIRDRLRHSALSINITGENHRGFKAHKLASKKKDA